MRELKEKRKIQKILFSKVSVVFFSLILLLIVSATWGVHGKYQETGVNKQKALEDLAAFKQRESELQQEITGLQTERRIEKEIRENFGFVREGEEVVVIVEESEVVKEPPVPVKPGFFAGVWISITSFLR